MKSIFGALAFVLAVFVFVAADEGRHREEITEAQVGTVHFPTTCSASVQKQLERGVAMLHSFWYEEAEKQFKQIEQQDSACAIAHWGVAMSLWHQLWNHPDIVILQQGAADLASGRRLHASPREQEYLAALYKFYSHPKRPFQKRATEYSAAMEQLSKHYPDDHEAAAFYALSLLAAEPENYKGDTYRTNAAQILEKLFAEEPNHPGVAHYLIHTYDKPDMAQRGLPAARRYAQLAPAAPHALHMPSHIFARLGLWQDDIDSNLASIAATQKEAAMNMGGEGHQFHAMDFLVYAYLQTGREQDAQKIIDEVRAMPPMHDMYGMGFDPHVTALATFEASYALELHHWNEAAQLKPVPGASDANRSMTYLARAIGAARSGQIEEARRDATELRVIQKKLAPNKNDDQGEYRGVTDDLTIAEAWIAFAEGHHDDAVRQLRGLADKQEGEAEASQGIPAHEMIGDMLLQANRPADALAEYDATLKTDPGRFDALYGAAQAAVAVGQADKAKDYYSQIVRNCSGATSERAELKHAREEVNELAQSQ